MTVTGTLAPALAAFAVDAARLPHAFYARDARVVARALVGTYLVHGERVGRIVETEAYRGPKDLACHARAGRTKRTATLYGPSGHAYVFLIYGMYDCFNVVCFGEGKGHAVLIRGVEPVRGVPDGTRTDGPGRLARALGLSRTENAVDLVATAHLWIAPRTKRPRIAVSPRVGVAYAGEIAEAPWRFYDATSKHVSRPSPRTIGLGGVREPRR
jgi:DNA-3-methyladenine glycosylase